MSKRELVAKINDVKREIEELNRITSIGNLESFELIISKIKEDIIRDINEEDFKAAKNNMGKINKMRDFTNYIEKPRDLIEQKEDELEDLQYQLDNYQMNMFEEYSEEDSEPEDTGIKHNNKMLRTGDVYKLDGENEQESRYFMVVSSKEMPEKFALITNYIEGEHLLQYPKNQELLNRAAYLGNTYFKDKKAQDGLDRISYFWESISE